jgi:hypothetical protein
VFVKERRGFHPTRLARPLGPPGPFRPGRKWSGWHCGNFGPKPCNVIWSGDVHGSSTCKGIWFGDIHSVSGALGREQRNGGAKERRNHPNGPRASQSGRDSSRPGRGLVASLAGGRPAQLETSLLRLRRLVQPRASLSSALWSGPPRGQESIGFEVGLRESADPAGRRVVVVGLLIRGLLDAPFAVAWPLSHATISSRFWW